VVDVTAPSPYPAQPIKRICDDCEVVSTNMQCWLCGGAMRTPEDQKAATLVRLAGCKSDEPERTSAYTPRESRNQVYP
jgi:hypothetical protein